MSSTPNDGYVEVLWPRGPRQLKSQSLARRLQTLEGKKVAQLWDSIFKGDEVFEGLEDAFKERYPNIEWVSWREFGNTHGDSEREIVEALPKKLREMGVDAVISGMGC